MAQLFRGLRVPLGRAAAASSSSSRPLVTPAAGAVGERGFGPLVTPAAGAAGGRGFGLAPAGAELNAGHYEILAASTRRPLTEAKALHPSFYVDEAYRALEQNRIFGQSWFAAAHTAELSNPGDVKVVDVGGTSIILTCDRHGKLHAFYNVCRHRGAKVCSKSTTNCKQLVCPYHWWSYRLDGTLKATPPVVTPQERKENLGLKPVPGMQVFAGMIFLNQAPNPPPLSDLLVDLPEKLARFDLDHLELVEGGIRDYSIKGNWKLVAENFVDFYHINAVHPELAQFSRVDDHKAYQGVGQYVGFVTEPLTNSGGPGDLHNFNLFPRISKVEATAGLFFQIFPNVSLTIYPHSVYTLITLPGKLPGETQEQLTVLMAPQAKKKEDCADEYLKKTKGLVDFICQINDEDVVAIENLQSGLINARDLDVQGEFLPEYDWPIHRFQNMVLSRMMGVPWKEYDVEMPELCNEFEKSVKDSVSA